MFIRKVPPMLGQQERSSVLLNVKNLLPSRDRPLLWVTRYERCAGKFPNLLIEAHRRIQIKLLASGFW